MRKSLILVAYATLIVFGCKSSQQNVQEKKAVETVDPTVYGNTITSSELKDLLYTYASDEFEGRETGERGQKLAVNFLKQQYENLGIPSPISKDDYFQEVPLTSLKTVKSSITVNGKAFENYTDFVVTSTIPSQTFDTKDIVYAGYGIDDANYSDYKNLDVKGKIVLVKAGEPKNADGTFVISGTTEKTQWFDGRQASNAKRDAAKKNGAKAILIMDDAYLKRASAYYKKRAENSHGKIELNDRLKNSMAQILISDTLGKALYTTIETDAVAKTITTNLNINIESETKAVHSENVVAFIKGSEKPDEVLVISSHLDHIGITNGQINNGADDDGSGTVALLEIAEAFRKAQLDGHGPKRSILFLHVTGEEKGLLGSSYYTDVDPIFPLANTVADLNIDMIGRTDPKREGDRNYVYLIGSDRLSTELHNVSEDANNKYTHITLDYKYNDEKNDVNRYYYRSDHYNFAKNNIPIIFYFNGTHDDYHQPTDTPDKIQYDLLENRARLVFYTAWEVANRPMRLKVDKLNQ